MKTLICSTLVLFLVACGGGGSSDAEKTAKFSKAPPGEQAATLRGMYNEFSKKCPNLKMGEMTEDETNRFEKDCSSEELTKFHETLVCMQKTACEDTAAQNVCREKMEGVSNKCLGEKDPNTDPEQPQPNPSNTPDEPGNDNNHDHESHAGHNAGHNHGRHAPGVHKAPADMSGMPEAMKNMFNNMGNAGHNAGHNHGRHSHAQPADDTAPNHEGDSDDAEDGQTPMMG